MLRERFDLVRVLGHRDLDSLAASRSLRSLTWDRMQQTMAQQEALSRRLVVAVHAHHATEALLKKLALPPAAVQAILDYSGSTFEVVDQRTRVCSARKAVEPARGKVVQEISSSCRVLVATQGAFAKMAALKALGLLGFKIDLVGIDEIGGTTVFGADMLLSSLAPCLHAATQVFVAGDPNQIGPILPTLFCVRHLQTNYSVNLSLAESFLRSIEQEQWQPGAVVRYINLSNRNGPGKRLRSQSAHFLSQLSELRFGEDLWADRVGRHQVWAPLQGRTASDHAEA